MWSAQTLEQAANSNLIPLEHEHEHVLGSLSDSEIQEFVFGEIKQHGTIGFFTSLIVFISCFVTLPKLEYLFPAIAAGRALIGAMLSRWLIRSFLLVSIVGIGLIALSHFLVKKMWSKLRSQSV